MDTGLDNNDLRISHFSLQLHFKWTWNVVEKSDNLSVNFAPAAAKLIIVDSLYRSWIGYCKTLIVLNLEQYNSLL
jgi:hypothetical protein